MHGAQFYFLLGPPPRPTRDGANTQGCTGYCTRNEDVEIYSERSVESGVVELDGLEVI